jgi:hypothetical protein
MIAAFIKAHQTRRKFTTDVLYTDLDASIAHNEAARSLGVARSAVAQGLESKVMNAVQPARSAQHAQQHASCCLPSTYWTRHRNGLVRSPRNYLAHSEFLNWLSGTAKNFHEFPRISTPQSLSPTYANATSSQKERRTR